VCANHGIAEHNVGDRGAVATTLNDNPIAIQVDLGFERDSCFAQKALNVPLEELTTLGLETGHRVPVEGRQLLVREGGELGMCRSEAGEMGGMLCRLEGSVGEKDGGVGEHFGRVGGKSGFA